MFAVLFLIPAFYIIAESESQSPIFIACMLLTFFTEVVIFWYLWRFRNVDKTSTEGWESELLGIEKSFFCIALFIPSIPLLNGEYLFLSNWDFITLVVFFVMIMNVLLLLPYKSFIITKTKFVVLQIYLTLFMLGVISFVNCTLDSSPERVFQVPVSCKEIQKVGRDKKVRFSITLNSFEDVGPQKLYVEKSFYNNLSPGDEIVVHIKKVCLNIAWISSYSLKSPHIL